MVTLLVFALVAAVCLACHFYSEWQDAKYVMRRGGVNVFDIEDENIRSLAEEVFSDYD
jgi:hypothetical protein